MSCVLDLVSPLYIFSRLLLCQTALAPTKKNRLQIEDLRRALSRPGDAKKLARMEELLFMQEDIKRARKQFEENEMGGGIE